MTTQPLATTIFRIVNVRRNDTAIQRAMCAAGFDDERCRTEFVAREEIHMRINRRQ
jgi:hypothetical protein